MSWKEGLDDYAQETARAGWSGEPRSRPIPRQRWEQAATLCEVLEKWGCEPQLEPEPPNAVAIQWDAPGQGAGGFYTLTLADGSFGWHAESDDGEEEQGSCATAKEAMAELRRRMPGK